MFRNALAVLSIVIIFRIDAFSQTGSHSIDGRESTLAKRELLNSALAMIDSGYLDRSIDYLDSLLRIEPANPEAFLCKARIFGWQGDSASAIDILSGGVERSPRTVRLRTALARLLIETKAYDDAWNHVDKALAVISNDGEALYLKGLILEKRGDIDNALEMYKKAAAVSLGRLK